MSLYERFQEKYYAFMDWLQAKKIPAYKFVDALENKNIPSFPVFILLIVLLIAGIGFGAMALLTPAMVTISFNVSDTSGVALEKAMVSLTGAEFSQTKFTDEDGLAMLQVQIGKELKIIVSKKEYVEKILEAQTFQENKTLDFELEKEIIMLAPKTISVIGEGGEVITEEVAMQFSCSNEEAAYDNTAIAKNGEVEVKDIPNNCGALILEFAQGYTVEDSEIDLATASPNVLLKKEETQGDGTVYYEVKDEEGSGVFDLTITLYAANDLIEQMDTSPQSGSGIFENVPTGIYYLSISGNGDYTDIVTEKQVLETGKSIYFTATMKESEAGKIKLKFVDSVTQTPVNNAEVKLLKDKLATQTKYSNEAGEVEFSVSINTEYEIEVDHPAYMLLNKKGLTPQEMVYIYYLEMLTANNAQSIVASVNDQYGKPVDGAKVKLRMSDATPVGDELVTGSDGKVEFLNVQPGEYYLYAVKEGFDEEYTETFMLKPKQIIEKEITLNIGNGTIIVNVVDEENNPVHGASVKALNVYQQELLEEQATDAEGNAKFSIRADKKAFFVAEHSDFLSYVSSPINPSTTEAKNETIVLAKDVPQVQVKFLELKYGEDTVFNSLDAGKSYTGKVQVLVPKNSSYDTIGMHVRVGNEELDKTNLMEEDIAFIKGINSSATKTKKGSTYTPETGMGTDLANLTGGNAKWVNTEWDLTKGKLPESGVFELGFELEVKGEAVQGDVLNLFYRGFGLTGATFERDPFDEMLGGNESTINKQSLYAEAKAASYSIGPSNLCSNGFCKQLQVEDLGVNLKTSVVDAFTTKISGEYELTFTITQQTTKSNPAAELIISNESNGLLLKNWKVKNAAGKQNAGNAEGFELKEIVGDLTKGSQISGTIRFETQKEGVNDLKLGIVSAKQEIFSQTLQVQVNPAKEMLIEVLPKVIIPYIDNKVLIKVINTDETGSAVPNATINVFVNDEIITSAPTNAEGVLALEIESPALGDVIKIEAKKNDYKTIVMEVKVTEDLASVLPPEIKLDFVPATGATQEQMLVFTNLTVLALKIEKIALTPEFAKLIKLEKETVFKDMQLDLNKDVNAVLTMSLTDEGKMVIEPTSIEGALMIYLTNAEVKKTWVLKLPASIRILLGGEVDKKDCLFLLDEKGQALKPALLIASKEPLAIKGVLKNDCRVSNNPISLNELKLKIDLKGANPLGEFRIESNEFDAGTIALKEEEIVVKKMVKAEQSIPFTLTFYPNAEIKSASSTSSIEFKANHLTETGIEEIKTNYEVKTILTKLEECVKLVPVGLAGEGEAAVSTGKEDEKIIDLTLYTCTANTGWGQFPSHFGNGLGYEQGYGGQYNGYMGPLGNSGFGINGMGLNQQLGQDYGLYSSGMESYGTPMGGTGGNAYLDSYKYSGMGGGGGGMGYGSGYYGNSQYGTANSYYPNQGYGNPFMSGYGSGTNNMNWMCEQNADQGKFKIVNTCEIPIEVKLDETAQVKSKKNSFEVNAKGEVDVILVPGIFSGRYPMKVNARIAKTENNFSEIGTVYATIIRPGEILMKCKPVLNPTTFQVPFIGWLETEGKIYNYCSNMGYKLMPFGAQNISCYTPEMTPTMPGQVMGPVGACPLISYVRSSPPQLIFQANGQATEVIEFGLRYNPDIVEQWPGFVEGTLNEQVGNLRLSAGRLTHSIIAPGKAVVQYTMPFSPQPVAEVYDITLMDPFQAFGASDVFMKKGSPELEPAECIREPDKYFDLVARAKGEGTKTQYPTDEWLNDTYFEKDNGNVAGFAYENKMQWLMKIPRTRQDVMGGMEYKEGMSDKEITEKYGAQPGTPYFNQFKAQQSERKYGDYCGEADSITGICPIIIDKKSGVQIRMIGTQSGHNIAMEVDRSAMNKKCAIINTKCSITVTRVDYHAGTAPVSLKVRVQLLNKGLLAEDVDLTTCAEEEYIPAEGAGIPSGEGEGEGTEMPGEEGEVGTTPSMTKGGTALFCSAQEGAETGQGAYEKYGFNKYLLSWKYEDIANTTCENYFCDAVQFSVYNIKRLNDIESKLTAYSDKEKAHIKEICGVISCNGINELKKLYPITKETITVFDVADNHKYLYFIGKDNQLLEATPIDSCNANALENALNDIITSKTYVGLQNKIDEINGKLEECYPGFDRTNLIAEIDDALVPADNPVIKYFTQSIFDDTIVGRILTFNEYARMHIHLFEDTNKETGSCNKSNTDMCDVEYTYNTGTGNSAQWTEFLQELLNKAEWKVVYNYKDDQPEEQAEFIRNNAKDRDGAPETETKKVYLIGDTFSEDFKEDFTQEYTGQTNANIDKWSFNQFKANKEKESLTEFKEDVDNEKISAGKNSGNYLSRMNPGIIVNTGTGEIGVVGENTKVEFGLLKTLGEISKYYEKNTFLKVPFEGAIGKKEGNNRTGYGSRILTESTWPEPEGVDCWEGRNYYAKTHNADPYCVDYDISTPAGDIPFIGAIIGFTCEEFSVIGDGSDCKDAKGTCKKGRCNAKGIKEESKKMLTLYNNYTTGEIGVNFTDALQGLTDAVIVLDAKSELKFVNLQDGKIISIGLKNKAETDGKVKGFLNYDAGLPVGLKIDSLKAGTTIYYRLTDGAGKAWPRKNYGYDESNPYTLLKWLKSDYQSIAKDSLNEHKKAGFCTNWKDEEKLLAKVETGGENSLVTTAIMQSDTYASKMELFCANNETQITSKSWESGVQSETKKTKNTSGGTVFLVPENERDTLGLKNYIELIKEEKVCVKTVRDLLGGAGDEEIDETHLIWNAEKFLPE